jgi:hypothetical protein
MKKSEFIKQIKEEILSNLSEKKKKKEPEEEVTDTTDIELPPIEDEGEPEGEPTGGDFDVDPKISKIQNALKSAYDGAKDLGDEKLSTQVGNTITYFTRAHVVNKEPGVAEGIKNTIKEIIKNKLKK